MPVNGACSELKAGRMKIETENYPMQSILAQKYGSLTPVHFLLLQEEIGFTLPRHSFDEDDYQKIWGVPIICAALTARPAPQYHHWQELSQVSFLS